MKRYIIAGIVGLFLAHLVVGSSWAVLIFGPAVMAVIEWTERLFSKSEKKKTSKSKTSAKSAVKQQAVAVETKRFSLDPNEISTWYDSKGNYNYTYGWDIYNLFNGLPYDYAEIQKEISGINAKMRRVLTFRHELLSSGLPDDKFKYYMNMVNDQKRKLNSLLDEINHHLENSHKKQVSNTQSRRDEEEKRRRAREESEREDREMAEMNYRRALERWKDKEFSIRIFYSYYDEEKYSSRLLTNTTVDVSREEALHVLPHAPHSLLQYIDTRWGRRTNIEIEGFDVMGGDPYEPRPQREDFF